MKALVQNNYVHQVEANNSTFPVAEGYEWVTVPQDVTPINGWTYDGATFSPPVVDEMENWLNGMRALDAVMPRAMEDIYDGMETAAQERVPQFTRDLIASKKTLRGEKPSPPGADSQDYL